MQNVLELFFISNFDTNIDEYMNKIVWLTQDSLTIRQLKEWTELNKEKLTKDYKQKIDLLAINDKSTKSSTP
jgi:hypothetical protein